MPSDPPLLLIDTHVHLHHCFRTDAFFNAALANLAAGRRDLHLSGTSVGCLLFAETKEESRFFQLRSMSGRPSGGRWGFEETDEEFSLIARREDGERLLLLAGRQIVTRDGLEVLALGYSGNPWPETTTVETIEQALAADALPVIPWGFGKWWFGRGALVRRLIESEKRGRFFLGDNGGRPRLSTRPKLFDLAESRGIPVLPGSDPLPFASEESKAGSYGLALEGTIEGPQPGERIKYLLRQPELVPKVIGHRERLVRFCKHQVAMQLRKRVPNKRL